MRVKTSKMHQNQLHPEANKFHAGNGVDGNQLDFDLSDRSECVSKRPVGIPLITVLNYSGGKQSSALLWMILRRDIKTPKNFYVLNADPGMEHRATYEYTEMMRAKCHEAGIDFRTVDGPNLYDDLINNAGKKRIDNPGYFTKNDTGREGRLRQGCTKYYKIRPIAMEVRRILSQKHQVGNRLRDSMVEQWIGFGFDETPRISEPDVNYRYFRYPLIEMGMDRQDVEDYYGKNGLPQPPRSVCVACFANSTQHYAEQHASGTDDFDRAVKVDEAVRDLSHCGVKHPVYVHRSLVPLRVMPDRNFEIGATAEERERNACTSGHCFL